MRTISYNFNDTANPIVNSINRILPKLPIAIFIFLLAVLLIKVLSMAIRFGLSLTKAPRGLQDVIAALVDVALWIFLGIAMLQYLGLNNIALAVTGSFAFIVLGLSQGGGGDNRRRYRRLGPR